MSDSIEVAVEQLRLFKGVSLAQRIASIEQALLSQPPTANASIASSLKFDPHLLLRAAFIVKKAASQIDVIIHAVGMLVLLPQILHPGERIESISLGANSGGRNFDLETDLRVAQFKFQQWQPKGNAVRERELLKDFYYLAEYDGPKERYLYQIGMTRQREFLTGQQALSSVLRRYPDIVTNLVRRYGNRFQCVGDYFAFHSPRITIIDASQLLAVEPFNDE